MTPLDNLRRIVAGWRGEWRVDAHEGITLSHDGDEWPIASMDGDAVVMLVELLNAIRPAVDGATAETARLTAELAAERRSDREAVAFANDAAIGDFIDGHAKRLCEQAGEHWTGDGEQLDAWAAKVHDVLNHLRADADGTVLDGRASQPATVGGLLATAPTVEATAEEGARMARRIGDTYDLTIPVGRGRALAAMKLAEAIIASGHPHRSEP